MPNVTGGRGSFGGSAAAGRDASNTGTGRSSAERAAQAGREAAGRFKTTETPTGRVFTSTAGLSSGISVSPGAALQKQNQERMSTYNAAAGRWNNSAKQRSIGNLVNHMSPMGFSMEAPDIARPSTFSEGDYHMGWNPGSLAGLMSPVPGGGIALGALGQMAYSGLGGKNLMLGGSGDMGMPSWDAPGTGNVPGGNPSGAMTPGGGQLADRGGGAIISGPVQAAPNIFAPQQQAAAPAPQIFAPKPVVKSPFQVPGGSPYGFNLFARTA